LCVGRERRGEQKDGDANREAGNPGRHNRPRLLVDNPTQLTTSARIALIVVYATRQPDVHAHRRAPTNLCEARRSRARPGGACC